MRKNTQSIKQREWQLNMISSKKKPTLFIIAGPPGVGKSTVAKQIGNKLNIKIFSNDKVRWLKGFKKEYKKYRKSNSQYPTRFRKKIYNQLLKFGENEILNGKSIILDATFSREWQRNLAKNLAKEVKAKLVSIDVRLDKLSDEKIIKRFKDRLKKDKKATLPKIYFLYKRYYQPFTKPNFIINNDTTLQNLKKQVQYILKKHL